MYNLEFLPIAKKDMDDIIFYISNNLKNNTAAAKTAQNFIKEANQILEMPYSYPIYQTKGKLKQMYRSKIIDNFIMFYTINEENKIITIIRVLYQKRDISNILQTY